MWLLASYINHACSYNSVRHFIGDMMIVRATRDLPQGQETRLLTSTLVLQAHIKIDGRRSMTSGASCVIAVCARLKANHPRLLTSSESCRSASSCSVTTGDQLHRDRSKIINAPKSSSLPKSRSTCTRKEILGWYWCYPCPCILKKVTGTIISIARVPLRRLKPRCQFN